MLFEIVPSEQYMYVTIYFGEKLTFEFGYYY